MPGRQLGRPPPARRSTAAPTPTASGSRAAEPDDVDYEDVDLTETTPTLDLAGYDDEGPVYGDTPYDDDIYENLDEVDALPNGQGVPRGAEEEEDAYEDDESVAALLNGGGMREASEEEVVYEDEPDLNPPPPRSGMAVHPYESDEESEDELEEEDSTQDQEEEAAEVNADELAGEIGQSIQGSLGNGRMDWGDYKDEVRNEVRQRTLQNRMPIPEMFQLQTVMPQTVLGWGREHKAFWRNDRDDDYLHSQHYGMQFLSSRVVERLVGQTFVTLRALQQEIDDPGDDGVPMTAEEVQAYMTAHDFVAVEGSTVSITTGGVGVLARMASEEEGVDDGRFTEGAHAPDRGQEGYATAGMMVEHSAMDRMQGSRVKYHRSAEEQAPTVLKLEGGEFRWAADDSRASGPDLSQANPNEVWQSSPAFATMRKRELVGQGVDPRQAGLQAVQEIRNSPRLIFVMDAAGDFYAARAKMHEIHHSTLLAGKAVAAAGELALSNGQCTMISDQSGHYMPGPAYTWQAVHSMAARGVDVGRVDVFMFGISSLVKGDWFLRNFVPGLQVGPRSLPMDANQARLRVNGKLASNIDQADAPIPGITEVRPVQDDPGLSDEEQAQELEEEQEVVQPSGDASKYLSDLGPYPYADRRDTYDDDPYAYEDR